MKEWGGQEIGLVEQKGAGAETELIRLVMLPDVKWLMSHDRGKRALY